MHGRNRKRGHRLENYLVVRLENCMGQDGKKSGKGRKRVRRHHTFILKHVCIPRRRECADSRIRNVFGIHIKKSRPPNFGKKKNGGRCHCLPPTRSRQVKTLAVRSSGDFFCATFFRVSSPDIAYFSRGHSEHLCDYYTSPCSCYIHLILIACLP